MLLSLSLHNGLSAKFKLGIEHLQETDFEILRGLKVGLLTHPAGVNGKGESSIEILRANSTVNLVALFGPEHGIYGNEKASWLITTNQRS